MDIGIISLFLIPIVLFILMERLFSNESVVLRIDSAFLYLNAFIWVLVLLFLFFTFNDLRVAIVIQIVCDDFKYMDKQNEPEYLMMNTKGVLRFSLGIFIVFQLLSVCLTIIHML